MKLISKRRRGAKLVKRYDQAKTPHQRILESPEVAEPYKQALRDSYRTLNPMWIRHELQRRLDTLWTLALRSGDL